jgi:ABC-type metal ion transport system substrate-binding protein
VDGFAELRDPDKLNVQPTRLDIRPAPRRAAFRSFVDESALPEGINATDLAIVNQVEIDATVDQGRPLKLPK